MQWYQYVSLGAFVVCFLALLGHFLRLLKHGNPKDLSEKSGNIPKAEVYAYTTAMLPNQKESAYMHIPSYASGILFHCSTFVCFLLFVIFFFVQPDLFPATLTWILVAIVFVGGICGFGLFLKRFFSRKLRGLSHVDDFLSNAITTLFQLATVTFLLSHYFAVFYYIVVSLLFLYMPVGKLRHVVYFFAARWHLGFFYGWRNSWPPKNNNK